MKLHANAALSLRQRERMVSRVVEEGWSITKAAMAAEVSEQTCSKWVHRYRQEGEAGLVDRSSAPQHVANRTDEDVIQVIAALRRLRFTGPEISELLDRPLSTVSGILGRIGMGRLGRLGLEPANRYERQRAGELIHVDVKKLGRIHGGAGKRVTGVKRNPLRTRVDGSGVNRKIIGWDYVHVAIDDATRLAYAEVLPDEKATTAIAFLGRAVAFFSRHGMIVQRADHRQRLGLPLDRPRDRLPHAGHPPPTHTPLPAADQRQSRALHPDHARRLGLRRDLRLQRRTHSRP
jgi:transposase